jgi:flagellar protein FlbD
MIAVTCRNGEHFSVDPAHIERVETHPDTVIHLVDGTRYAVSDSFDDLLRTVRDHRASVMVAQKRLSGGTAEIADHASTVRRSSLRIERRRYRRDDDAGGTHAAPPPDRDGD